MEQQPDFFMLLLIAVGAVVMMKFIPRLIAGVPFVEPDDLKKMMDQGRDVVILDVRSAAEFTGKMGHVPGAVNVPLSQLAGKIRTSKEEFEAFKTEPIFLVCRSENRSPGAARMLRKLGFTGVSVLKGGMRAWDRKKLPTEGKKV